MLRTKLHKLAAEVANLKPPADLNGWDARDFDRLNRALSVLLDGAADRLGDFRERLKLRQDMQDLYKRVGEMEAGIAQAIWQEQYGFYPRLIGDIQRCIEEEPQDLVKFSITVAEMLLILRVFMEGGVFQVRALRPIFEFLAEHAKTPKGKRLSVESLQKKYSQVHPDTRTRVKRLLRDLAMRVDST